MHNVILAVLLISSSTFAGAQAFSTADGRYIQIDPYSGAAYLVDRFGNRYALDPAPGRRELSRPGSRGSYNRYETQRYWNNDMQYGSGACLASSDC